MSRFVWVSFISQAYRIMTLVKYGLLGSTFYIGSPYSMIVQMLSNNGSPLAVQVWSAKVWKSIFVKNLEWLLELWFGPKICWSRNKNCSFLWPIRRVQHLGWVPLKMAFCPLLNWQCKGDWYFLKTFSSLTHLTYNVISTPPSPKTLAGGIHNPSSLWNANIYILSEQKACLNSI